MKWYVLALCLVQIVCSFGADDTEATVMIGKGADTLRIVGALDGTLLCEVVRSDGMRERLTATGLAQFLARQAVYQSGIGDKTSYAVTELVWLVVGFLGQGLFVLRMGVQWIASERAGKVVVPVVYWWCSVGAASVLAAYFVQRGDLVGLVGSVAGLAVYSRSLVLALRSTAKEIH